MNDRFQVTLFSGNKWKAVPQVKAHLVAKYRKRAGSGAI